MGPRPLSNEEMTRNNHWKTVRLSVKPGLTGLWQIKGRGSNKFIDWVNYDLEYVQKGSFLMDVKIVFLTIFAVTIKGGAV